MNSKKLGIKALILSVAIAVSASACAADQVKVSPDGKQATLSGTGLQSLLNELSAIGIDPSRLRTLDPDGNVITPFTPGATVQWQRISTAPTTGTGIHANDVASGTGKVGDIEIDTVTKGTTITIFTWQYQHLSDGTDGWVAIGVVSYTVQANTSAK